MAVAQVDIGNEEIGIAAAVSGDLVAMADYRSGDPYRQFAVSALGILKPTKQQRQIYKACVLGRIYGWDRARLRAISEFPKPKRSAFSIKCVRAIRC
jgi:hypothetical protein